jgi:hypothetical protein
VIWGAYHGALVTIARLASRRRDHHGEARSDMWAVLEPLQVLGMFLLTCVGWLIFRETDVHMLWRDLTLSPWTTTLADRQVGRYLFLLTFVYSLPLWAHGVWAVYVAPGIRRREPPDTAWGGWTTTAQAVLAGLAIATMLVFRSRQSLDFIYFQF